MKTGTILLLMVGFLLVQDFPGLYVAETQVASILSLVGLSGLAILITWLEREVQPHLEAKLARKDSASARS